MAGATMSMTSDPVICCDANLVVDFAIHPESPSIEAFWNRLTLEPCLIVAPSLLRYEVTNAIHRVSSRNGMTTDAARRLLQIALEVPIRTIDDAHLHDRALVLSRQFRLAAAYDAHYLALSESLNCPFYTSDAKLHRATQSKLSWVHLV